jgi:coenzyme Q-binding protein COQ10
MPSFRTRRSVSHSAAQMFDLVADVTRYPEFVPLCERLDIDQRHTDADGIEHIVARMVAGYGPIREAFVSKVRLDRARGVIVAAYIDGPFRELENRWTFRDLSGACDVEFFIAYEFKSLPLQILMGAMFDKAFRKFSAAFEARADALYGRAVPAPVAVLPLTTPAN